MKITLTKNTGQRCHLAEISLNYIYDSNAFVNADIACLEIDVPSTIQTTEIVLPDKGKFGSDITWEFLPSNIISHSEGTVYRVTKPDTTTQVTMIATVQSGSASKTKSFKRTVTGKNSKPGGTTGSGSSYGGGSGGGSGGSFPAASVDYSSPASAVTQPSYRPSFLDIAEAEWAREYIDTLYVNGIVNGDQNSMFHPNQDITREEFLKMLMLLFEQQTPTAAIPFSDVDETAWYAVYIQQAVDAGIVNGYSDGTFGIGKNITREEMAVMVKRAIDHYALLMEPGNQNDTIYDEGAIAEYAIDAVKTLYAYGILRGDELGNFNPRNNTTRAEAAKIIAMLLENA